MLSACAFVDSRIVPTASLQGQRSELKGEGRVLVVQMPFSDNRIIRERCGMIKNGYGMDTASVICVGEPAVWIAELFVEELRAAGFIVKTDSDSITIYDLKIQGSLLKLFAEPIRVIETNVQIELIASAKNGFNAERSFFVKNSVSPTWGGYTHYYQKSIDNATRKIIQDMVASIVVLLIRYPELSVTHSPEN